MTPSDELINLISSGEDWLASPVDLTSTLLILNLSVDNVLSLSAASSSHPVMKIKTEKEDKSNIFFINVFAVVFPSFIFV